MSGKPLVLLFLCSLLPLAAGLAQMPPLGATVNRSGSTITGVTFCVWAPNATGVALRGDFNGWGETAMTKDNATGYWAASLAGARPGQEYKYFVRWTGNSSGSWKQDPRAVWVRQGNSVIYDHAAFTWGDTARPAIPVDRQVMYEMHIGSFHDPDPSDGRPGTFDDAIARLDYLRRLGVNVIALMPVNEFGSDYSWGYNPEHVFAVEAAYGGPDGLKRFVRAAHERGMKVQLDVVHNHWNAPGDGVWEFDGPANIYFPSDARRRWTPWGDRPDYAKPEVRDYIEDNIRMLLDEFRIDGFRWDSPQNILGFSLNSESANPDNVLPEGKTMMMALNRLIHEQYPGRWSIAEDSDLLSVVPAGYYGAGTFHDALRVASAADSFDGHWQTSFHNIITPQIAATSPDVGEILSKVNGWSEPPGYRVIFTDNHDKSGILNSSTRLASRMDPLSPEGRTARKKTLLNAVLTLTAPGTPMLWMGQEFHATGPFDDRQPFDWRAAAAQHRVFRAHRDLVALRETLPALQNSDLSTASGGLNEDLDVVIYFRRAGGLAANDVVVFLNFSGQTRNNVNVPFSSSGTWHVQMNTDWPVYGADFNNIGPGGAISVGSNGRAELSIGPHSAIIFARNPAAAGVSVDDADGDGMSDGWESMTGVPDPDGDPDGDGISNLREYQLGFDPGVADPTTVAGTFNGWNSAGASMRASGVTDEVEYLYWSPEARTEVGKFIFAGAWYGLAGQPNLGAEDNIAFTTPSGGYVRLAFNTRTRTHSITMIGTTAGAMIDADNDGMDDHWERFHGVSSAAANPDGDAFTNLQEFGRGSDPNAWNRALLALAGEFNGWSAGANPMIFAGNTTWIYELPLHAGVPGSFKFTAGTWSTAWGDVDGDGIAEDWSDRNIIPTLTSGHGIYRFNFDEQSWAYRVTFDATDADGDGLQDAWERYYNIGDRAADPDNDGLTNLAEFRRGSHPFVANRMAVVGGTNPLAWNPDADALRMTWSDARQRWEWTGDFAAATVPFKFATGPGWVGENFGTGTGIAAGVAATSGAVDLSVNLAAGRHRFSFNEFTGAFSVERFPVAAEWREVFDLPPSVPWSADSDGDGVIDVAEYALNGNPRDAQDAGELKSVAVAEAGGVQRLVMQWLQRANDDGGLTVQPEASTSLPAPDGWSPVTASSMANPPGVPPGFQLRQISVPIDGEAKFLRLRVSSP
jgi:1,4-alpha-glucan branching enzyme